MKKKLLIYIGILVFALASCSKKNDDPQPATNPGSNDDGDGYNIVSIVPANGKVGDEIVITTNQIEDVSRVTFNGKRAFISSISNKQITVEIPEYATKGKVLLEVRDKDIKAESSEDFNVKYPADQLAFMGDDPRYGASGFTIGTKIYLGLDFSSSGKSDFWEFDTQTNTWSQKADFPGGKRGFAVGFTIDGKGYMGTGRDYINTSTSTWYKDFWQYDPATDQWTKKADFGGSARYGAVGFSVNGKGYIGTGRDDKGDNNDMWEYRPATDQWTQVANLMDGQLALRRYQSVAFVIGNKAYVGTGNQERKDFWEFDPTTVDQWRKVADFGGGGRSSAAAFAIGNKGYVTTGYTNPGYAKDVWEYNPATDQWTKKADFGGAQRVWAVAFAVGNKAYIGTGWGYKEFSDSFGYQKDFWQYNPN